MSSIDASRHSLYAVSQMKPVRASIHTVVFTPATEVLIQIKCRLTVSQLHIREPFCNDVEKSSVHSNSRTYATLEMLLQMVFHNHQLM